MKITETARRRVKSQEFMLLIKNEVHTAMEEGDSPDDVGTMAFTIIAWALAGRDLNEPPDMEFLSRFIHEHRPEIRQHADRIGYALVGHAFGPVN